MHNFDRSIVLAILMLTYDKPICSVEEVAESIFSPVDVVMEYLRHLVGCGFIEFIDFDDSLYIRVKDRLKLAYHAIGLGIDVKRVSKFLNWREFEVLCSEILTAFNYNVYRSVRFKHDSKRFELDVVGFKLPYVLCFDCKHWSLNRPSTLIKAIQTHYNKTVAFSNVFKSLFNLDFKCRIFFIPIIVTLLDEGSGIYDGLPVVSIFKLNSFLNELSIGINYIKFVEVA